MQITDIKQQLKNQARYSIYVDGKYSFGLSESELLNGNVKVGQQLTQDQLLELKDKAEIDKAYNNCLALIVRRKRSQWEIEQYLKRKGLEQEDTQAIVDRLVKSKWLNDLDFAKSWVSTRRLLKATSKRRLAQELKAKRVSDAVIADVLAQDETSDYQVLASLIANKSRQTRYQDRQKLLAYLMRQGYSYGDVKQALIDYDSGVVFDADSGMDT